MTDIQQSTIKPLWTRNYILVLVNNFFTFMIHFALFTNIPAYIKHIGGTNATAGLATTVYTIAALCARPLFGYLTDKLGRRAVIIIGMVISLAVAVLFYFANTASAVLIIRAIGGVGFSAMGTVTGTLVADNVPHERLSEGIGYSGISLTMATAIGPFIGVKVINMFGYRALFIYMFIVTVISFVIAMILKYRPIEGQGETGKGLFSAIFEKSSFKPALIVVVLALGFSSVATFLTTFGEARGLQDVSVFFIIYAFVALLARIATGKIADRRGVNVVFIPSLVIGTLALILLSLTQNMFMLVVAAVLYGTGYGISYPMINVMVMKVCPPNRRGAAVAMIFAGIDVGTGVGAMIWGMTSEGMGFSAVYVMAAGVVMLAMATYYILLYKKMREEAKALAS